MFYVKMSDNRVFKGPLRRRRERRIERRARKRDTPVEETKKKEVRIREEKGVVVVKGNYTPISKSSESGYCLTCLRDHLHKAKGLLREAEKQLTRDGEISPSIRRKIELVEEELSSAETEHVWNVQLENEGENRRLKAIGSQISNLRKDLENTQMGFRNPNIPVKGDVGDISKAINRADEILDDVHDSMADCPSCSDFVGIGRRKEENISKEVIDQIPDYNYEGQLYLITAEGCPTCVDAKNILKNEIEDGTVIVTAVDDDKGYDITSKLQLFKAPTMVIQKPDGSYEEIKDEKQLI